MDVLLWLIGITSNLWLGFLKVAGWLSHKWHRLLISFGLGAGLIWYGASPWPGATPQAGPGSYVPPPSPMPSGPAPAPAPPAQVGLPPSPMPSGPAAAPAPPAQVVLPPIKSAPQQVPVIQAQAMPELDGVAPPAPLPELPPELPPTVARGYRSPLPAPYYRPY